jgi:hypothetical protein
MHLPLYFSVLARACGELGQFEEARSSIGEAMTAIETTKETWYEAEVHRIAGEIALMSPERDEAKAEACFERALAVARSQQAKSWELRAAMSMARLWRDQGNLPPPFHSFGPSLVISHSRSCEELIADGVGDSAKCCNRCRSLHQKRKKHRRNKCSSPPHLCLKALPIRTTAVTTLSR